MSRAECYGLPSSSTWGAPWSGPLGTCILLGKSFNIMVFASLGSQEVSRICCVITFAKRNLYSNKSWAHSSLGLGYLRPNVPSLNHYLSNPRQSRWHRTRPWPLTLPTGKFPSLRRSGLLGCRQQRDLVMSLSSDTNSQRMSIPSRRILLGAKEESGRTLAFTWGQLYG